MIRESLNRAKQGKVQGVTGQKYFYRAKLIWPPMFSYDSWKSHFSQIIVFLRVNFKICKFYRAKLRKISANTKLFFWVFAKLQLKWMCFCHFWKCATDSHRAKSFLQGNLTQTPIKLYETLTSENTHFTHPRCFPMIRESLNRAKQGKVQGVTGQKYFYRAKLIWPPMFSYDSWKSHFSQIIVFLRVNFKICKFYRAKLRKISANTKLFFWVFAKLQLKWMCFCHFWKCGHFSLTDTRCFTMPNCMKNHIFVNLCGGIHRCTFKLASMYYMRLFLIYTLSLKHK